MTILIVNDDGVHSAGLHATYHAVRPLDEAVICAPHEQKTGTGRGFSLHKPIRVKQVPFDDITAYATSGTPVDSLLYAIHGLDLRPRLVVSGINLGENISTEITSSGTVGVAIEAASLGIPAIAVSMELKNDMGKLEEGHGVDFSAAVLVTRRIASRVLASGFPPGVDLLNVNIPHGVRDDTPVEYTFLERNLYDSHIEERIDPMGRPYYWNVGIISQKVRHGSDVHCVLHKGHVSITPISIDMTAPVACAPYGYHR